MSVWAAGSGLGTVIGLFFFYRGLRIGKVGVVAALASTEGAIAAAMAIVAGERPNIPVIVMLFVITGGVATVTFNRPDAMNAMDNSSKTLLLASLEQVAKVVRIRTGETNESAI